MREIIKNYIRNIIFVLKKVKLIFKIEFYVIVNINILK